MKKQQNATSAGVDVPMKDDWIKRIKKGDVLQSGTGKFRIVRAVHRGHKGTSVTFAINHPSWTTRPYTVYMEADLRTLCYRPVATKPFPLRTQFDKMLEQCFGAPRAEDCVMRARDVVGIA